MINLVTTQIHIFVKIMWLLWLRLFLWVTVSVCVQKNWSTSDGKIILSMRWCHHTPLRAHYSLVVLLIITLSRYIWSIVNSTLTYAIRAPYKNYLCPTRQIQKQNSASENLLLRQQVYCRSVVIDFFYFSFFQKQRDFMLSKHWKQLSSK